MTYPILVNDVDDDDKRAIVFSVVDECNPSDLDVPLERLHTERRKIGIRKKLQLDLDLDEDDDEFAHHFHRLLRFVNAE